MFEVDPTTFSLRRDFVTVSLMIDGAKHNEKWNFKEESFQTEKALVLFDVRQFIFPFVTWSQDCQAFLPDEVKHHLSHFLQK